MATDKYQEISGDENLGRLQAQLAESQALIEKYQEIAAENERTLSAYEQITSEAAVALAEEQSELAQICHEYESNKAQLRVEHDVLTQQQETNAELLAQIDEARAQLEAGKLKCDQALELIEELSHSNKELEERIERSNIAVKATYNKWQKSYDQLQEKKQLAAEHRQTIRALIEQVEELSRHGEAGEELAAESIADRVLEQFSNNSDISELPLSELPKAALEVSDELLIPRPTPLDDSADRATPSLGKPLPFIAPAVNEDGDTRDDYYREQHNLTFDAPAARPAEQETATAAESGEQVSAPTPPEVTGQAPAPSTLPKPPAPKPIPPPTILSLENADDDGDPDFWQPRKKKPPLTPAISSRPAAAPAASETLPDSLDSTAEPTEAEPSRERSERREKGERRSSLRGYLLCVIIALLLAFIIKQFVFQITIISGDSMLPTLENDDRVLSSSISYYINEPQRGDIIVFTAPDRTDNACYVKRVIGVAGDHIVIYRGEVYVNDELLEEAYLTSDEVTNGNIDTIVPADTVFVLGDNRSVSHDSRNENVSFIDTEDILSKAIVRIYPFDAFGSIYQ